jgi:porphobilinogen synthase
MISMKQRPRRNRKNAAIRSLVREQQISVNDLIMPFFVMEGENEKVDIPSMPGQFRYGLQELLRKVDEFQELGGKSIALFPVVNDELKTADAAESFNPDSLNQKTISALKERFPDLLVMTDVALDPYSIHGQDGLVDEQSGEILNDETLEVLGKMALAQAQRGTDIVGPSDMMDGRVGYLRELLDAEGYQHVSIMSYTAKYASSFYGPFRDALDSAPRGGDKKSYQMDYANAREALREMRLDIQEGADVLMVKPGMSYLDILYRMRLETDFPLAAYHVSGEYAMVKAAAERGWIDEKSIVEEILTSFKRAGADIILSYYALDFARWRKS